MEQTLDGISKTLIIPLWARAVEIKHSNLIIKDYKAIEMMGQIEYDFNRFDSEWATQISIAVRTEILDNVLRNL
jgi:O-methyltransferase involved in polyketide biosynthesis